MSHDARALANFVLDHSDYVGAKISNLALQKILFFLHGWWLSLEGEPLVKQAFEAWDHGPVVRVAYKEFKKFGSEPIAGRAFYFDLFQRKHVLASSNFTTSEVTFITEYSSYYCKINAYDLRRMTHMEDGPWDKVYYDRLISPGKIIDNYLIKRYFDNSKASAVGGLGRS